MVKKRKSIIYKEQKSLVGLFVLGKIYTGVGETFPSLSVSGKSAFVTCCPLSVVSLGRLGCQAENSISWTSSKFATSASGSGLGSGSAMASRGTSISSSFSIAASSSATRLCGLRGVVVFHIGTKHWVRIF